MFTNEIASQIHLQKLMISWNCTRWILRIASCNPAWTQDDSNNFVGAGMIEWWGNWMSVNCHLSGRTVDSIRQHAHYYTIRCYIKRSRKVCEHTGCDEDAVRFGTYYLFIGSGVFELFFRETMHIVVPIVKRATILTNPMPIKWRKCTLSSCNNRSYFTGEVCGRHRVSLKDPLDGLNNENKADTAEETNFDVEIVEVWTEWRGVCKKTLLSRHR